MSFDLTSLRKSLGLTQAEMAKRMDMGARTYFALEADPGSVKDRHVRVAESVAIDVAIERRNPMLAPARARKAALELVRMMTEG